MTDNDSKKFDRDAWLRKVEGLLRAADSMDKPGHDGSPANPEGAAQYRAKAEALMNQFRIEEEELRDAMPLADQNSPITRVIRICDAFSKHSGQYRDMIGAAVWHSGCRWAIEERRIELLAHITGFSIDVQYAEILFLNASVVFAAHLEPAYDQNESEAENIYRLRRAGVTRRAIAVKLWGKSVDHSVPAHGKVQKIYEAECKARGEDPLSGRGVSRAVYAELYAKQFAETFRSRLYRARTSAGLNQAGEMVLANRKERVEEAYYEAHPYLRPTENDKWPAEATEETEAAKKRRAAELQKRWAAEDAKANSPAGMAGRAAGAHAAEQVPLRGNTSSGRIGEGE